MPLIKSIIRDRCIPIIAAAIYSFGLNLAQAASDLTPNNVQLQPRGHGWVLATERGMTLYTFDQDQEVGTSACNSECAQTWPPLMATSTDSVPVDWMVIRRLDGSKQWSYRGKPLYTYSRDESPGDAYGDEVNGQWATAIRPIAVPAGVRIFKTTLGHVLADANYMTLYSSDDDRDGTSACNALCARTWQPLVAPWVTASIENWTTITRNDGTKQWAYKGKPLYRHADDILAGESLGDGAHAAWRVLILELPPPNPSWVTIHSSDSAEIFADANGRTLYAYAERRNRRAATPPPTDTSHGQRPIAAVPVGVVGNAPPSKADLTCGVECPDSDWRPVFAAVTDKPTGNWSLAKRADGALQWAHKGRPLYTNVRDKLPGDFNGIRHDQDYRNWSCITTSGKPMQGTGA